MPKSSATEESVQVVHSSDLFVASRETLTGTDLVRAAIGKAHDGAPVWHPYGR
ncbi:MAG: hypothetical protein HY299_18895 [Verrucomicrobia bacterium]|nr:hypothetical protein [Verrucomicrobiota bacterium]